MILAVADFVPERGDVFPHPALGLLGSAAHGVVNVVGVVHDCDVGVRAGEPAADRNALPRASLGGVEFSLRELVWSNRERGGNQAGLYSDRYQVLVLGGRHQVAKSQAVADHVGVRRRHAKDLFFRPLQPAFRRQHLVYDRRLQRPRRHLDHKQERRQRGQEFRDLAFGFLSGAGRHDFGVQGAAAIRFGEQGVDLVADDVVVRTPGKEAVANDRPEVLHAARKGLDCKGFADGQELPGALGRNPGP